MQQPGSVNLSPKAMSRRVSLTRDQFSMFELLNLPTTNNVISLPASAAGPTLSGSPDGLTTNPSGPEAVPASPSVPRESKKVSPTTATSGLSGENLSASAALQRSLENRLRAQLNGSDLCEVIWKPWTTPWGPCLSKPRARVRTTSATASGLWATIRASDGEKGGPNMAFGAGGQLLPTMAAHSIWQTPVADDAVDRVKGKVNSRGEPKLSAQAIQASSWPTPTTRDHKDGPYCPNVPVNRLLGRMVWPTPRASANENRQTKLMPSQMAGKHGLNLAAIVQSNGPSAQTEKRGALNPEFVCWLMGFPPEWVSCGVSGMQSIRAQRKTSSKRREQV